MNVLFDVEQLRYTYPDAFEALPGPYQEDDCLVFFVDINGNLCAEPHEDHTGELGAWEAVYDPKTKTWVTGDSTIMSKTWRHKTSELKPWLK